MPTDKLFNYVLPRQFTESLKQWMATK